MLHNLFKMNNYKSKHKLINNNSNKEIKKCNNNNNKYFKKRKMKINKNIQIFLLVI